MTPQVRLKINQIKDNIQWLSSERPLYVCGSPVGKGTAENLLQLNERTLIDEERFLKYLLNQQKVLTT